MSNLREVVRGILQREVVRKGSGWNVLVVDAEASKVLTPVLGMYDLMEEHVSLVESLEKRRQPFTEMGVIYVAAPSDKSVKAIAADWKGRDAPYAEAHVFFLSKVSEAQMSALALPELTPRLKSFAELNLDFLAVESQVFVAADVAKLATVCATLGDLSPKIRYRGEVAKAAAYALRDELKGPGGDLTVLVLDRMDDVMTPLMHEYTYQAMIQDVLAVEGDARDRVSYGKTTKSGESKDVAILSDKDALWLELRHEHIARVIDSLRAKTTEFLSHNSAAALSRGEDMSLGDMASALKKLPEFQAATAALNKHMSIAHECLTEFHKHKLLDASRLEQTLVTGKDEDGETVSPNAVFDDVAAFAKIGNDHAVRLACSYLFAKGGRIGESERAKLQNLPQDTLITFANHMADRGTPLHADAKKLEPKKKKSSAFSIFKKTKEVDISESRYVPPLKTILEALVDDKLSYDTYPQIGGRKTPAKQPAQSARKANKKATFSGPKFLVCVLGGCAYSEMKAAYDVSNATNRLVLLGGTRLLTPSTFLSHLSNS
ncbi:hypothetical protein CTAYLR_000921 [Chrysophaeum taylorii]|uniref:Uncharacterized protein n=1 Tax=Chrysophaeum taylorii TaxID=2483200 RepID=A0AAD7UGR4_9STRA|nr:hypothetical protein CTAYLR_000921 [Chrysophaeum taylorii]